MKFIIVLIQALFLHSVFSDHALNSRKKNHRNKKLKIKEGELEVIELPRGGFILQDNEEKDFQIQFGMPPETLKDTMDEAFVEKNNVKALNQYFICPSQFFDEEKQLSIAEFEFPTYYNFFFIQKQIKLICTQEQQEAISKVFQETLLGPKDEDKTKRDDYFKFSNWKKKKQQNGFIDSKEIKDRVDKQQKGSNQIELTEDEIEDLHQKIPSFQKQQQTFKFWEQIVFKMSQPPQEPKVENMIVFHNFDEEFKMTINGIEKQVLVQKLEENDKKMIQVTIGSKNKIFEDKVEIKNIKEQIEPKELQFNELENGKYPEFGVTVLGNAHGFEPSGDNSGYIIWTNGKATLVDPPPFKIDYLQKNGVNLQMIDSIILTHCHADHDAGILHSLDQLKKQGVVAKLVTTETIKQSFQRKYAAIKNISYEEMGRQLEPFQQVKIEKDTNIHEQKNLLEIIKGESFNFFYTLHVIPTLGFTVEYKGKSIYFSGDTIYDRDALNLFKKYNAISEYRFEFLQKESIWKHDVILFESGKRPIHTPCQNLENIVNKLKDKENLYLVHTHQSQLDEFGCNNLKIAPTGLEDTIKIDVQNKKMSGKKKIRNNKKNSLKRKI